MDAGAVAGWQTATNQGMKSAERLRARPFDLVWQRDAESTILDFKKEMLQRGISQKIANYAQQRA